MKDTPLSNCEKEFILQCISQRKVCYKKKCYRSLISAALLEFRFGKYTNYAVAKYDHGGGGGGILPAARGGRLELLAVWGVTCLNVFGMWLAPGCLAHDII